MANSIRARRRARPITAMRRPRRAAKASAHARSSLTSGRRLRQSTQADWTRSERTRGGPAFVMCPFRCRSAELASWGTNPTKAATRCASPPNRSGVSSVARKVSATMGPTPGAVISRRTNRILLGATLRGGIELSQRDGQLMEQRAHRREDRAQGGRELKPIEPRYGVLRLAGGQPKPFLSEERATHIDQGRALSDELLPHGSAAGVPATACVTRGGRADRCRVDTPRPRRPHRACRS